MHIHVHEQSHKMVNDFYGPVLKLTKRLEDPMRYLSGITKKIDICTDACQNLCHLIPVDEVKLTLFQHFNIFFWLISTWRFIQAGHEIQVLY